VKRLVLIEPVWQTIWQWPAVVNLICGAMACGYYLINLLVQGYAGTATDIVRFQATDLAAPLLVLIGFASVGIEAARPSAAKYLLHHLRTSWMSREVLVGSLFILFSTLDAFFSGYSLKIPAALFAVGLLFSQAVMVNRCRSVTSWNHSISRPHFLVSGIYLGFGLLLITGVPDQNTLNPIMLWIGLIASIANLTIWHRYVFAAGEGSLNQALDPLRKTMPLTLTHGLGHLMPLVMILIFILCTAFEIDYKTLKSSYMLCGIAIVFGCSAQKYYIILRANILREVFAEACAR
jgi:DMSO reductase anchor subunit